MSKRAHRHEPHQSDTKQHKSAHAEDSSAERHGQWNPERPGLDANAPDWTSQGELAGLGSFGPPYAPDFFRSHGRDSDAAGNHWREKFHGGFGNSGTPSEAAFNPASVNEGGESAAADESAETAEPAESEAEPSAGIQPASWAERAYGPRGFTGGFTGHEYNWKRRGDRPKKRE